MTLRERSPLTEELMMKNTKKPEDAKNTKTGNASSPRIAGPPGSLNRGRSAGTYALLSLTDLAHWNVGGARLLRVAHRLPDAGRGTVHGGRRDRRTNSPLDAYAIGGLETLARAAQMKEITSPLSQAPDVRRSSLRREARR